MNKKQQDQTGYSETIRYYDSIYYRNATPDPRIPGHLKGLASRVGIRRGQRILDVACGTGKWIFAVRDRGAIPTGIDLSKRAIQVCKQVMPDGNFCIGSGEELPFRSAEFDLVSCLGALEHFIDPELALKDMARVAKEDAQFLLLVPNAGFLTRRLGFFRGTGQVVVKEDVRSLQGWQELFESAGLHILKRWADLHVLSRRWITSGTWYGIPLRAAQAFALTVWPLSWQYQVYHLCQKRKG